MTANLLSIMKDSQESEIDEAKLRLICSKYNIWNHYGITRDHYVRLGDAEKPQIPKGFYKSKLPVYFGEGKLFVCWKNCVFVDDTRRQYCLNCKLNVIYCCCTFDDEKILSPNKRSLLTMSNTVKGLEKRRRKFLIEKIAWCLVIIFGNLLFCLVERNIFCVCSSCFCN